MCLSRLVIAVAAFGLSGCASAPELPESGAPNATGDLVNDVPNDPFVFNGTLDGQGFDVVMRNLGKCMFDPYPDWSYKLFDRYGLREFKLFPTNPKSQEDETFRIPVHGAPPFLFVGDGHACRSIPLTEAHGLVGAYKLDKEHGYSLNNAVRRLATDWIVVPPGERRVSVPWAPTELYWDLEQGFWERRQPSEHSTFLGYIRVLYPDGTLWGETGGLEGREGFEPPLYMPGNYTLEAEAHAVAVQPFEFRWVFRAMELDATVCDHGFEWSICK